MARTVATLPMNSFAVMPTPILYPARPMLVVDDDQMSLLLMSQNPAGDQSQQGAFDYVTKPVEPGRLATVVKNALTLQALQQEKPVLIPIPSRF